MSTRKAYQFTPWHPGDPLYVRPETNAQGNHIRPLPGQMCRCQHHPINHAYDKGGVRGRCLAQAEKCPCARYQPNEEND